MATASPAPNFIWPVSSRTITQPFTPGGHQGIDIGCPVGSPVVAPADGTVTAAYNDGGNCGNFIQIFHSNNYETRYCHLSQIQVTNDTLVKQGTQIALTGGQPGAIGAGDSTGPHLHFEIRFNGQPVDPIPLLNQGTAAATGPVKDAVGPGSPDYLGAIGDFFSAVTTGKTWVRVGQVLAGLALIWVAYYVVNEDITFSNLTGIKR